MDGQAKPFTKKERNSEYWVSISTLGGGSVCSPCLHESLEVVAGKDDVFKVIQNTFLNENGTNK